MTKFTSLIVGAVAGVLLGVVGVAAVLTALNPSADKVAADLAGQGSAIDPPAFYGSR